MLLIVVLFTVACAQEVTPEIWDAELEQAEKDRQKLELIVEALAEQDPEAVAAAKHEVEEEACAEALAGPEEAAADEFMQCLHMHAEHGGNIQDLEGVLKALRDQFGSKMADKDDQFWLAAFKGALIDYNQEDKSVITPTSVDTADR